MKRIPQPSWRALPLDDPEVIDLTKGFWDDYRDDLADARALFDPFLDLETAADAARYLDDEQPEARTVKAEYFAAMFRAWLDAHPGSDPRDEL